MISVLQIKGLLSSFLMIGMHYSHFQIPSHYLSISQQDQPHERLSHYHSVSKRGCDTISRKTADRTLLHTRPKARMAVTVLSLCFLFMGQKQCFFGKKCTITWLMLHVMLNKTCKFAIMCENHAFVAKIANTRLTKTFVAIFTLAETSASLQGRKI